MAGPADYTNSVPPIYNYKSGGLRVPQIFTEHMMTYKDGTPTNTRTMENTMDYLMDLTVEIENTTTTEPQNVVITRNNPQNLYYQQNLLSENEATALASVQFRNCFV